MELIKMHLLNAAMYSCLGILVASIYYHKVKIINNRIIRILFVGYIFSLLSQTIFPRLEIGILSNTGKIYVDVYYISYGQTINYIPFRSIVSYLRDIYYPEMYDRKMVGELNVLGNIFLFCPFGVLAPLLYGKLRKFCMISIASGIISLIIELVQLLIGRSFDIDDIILNTTGAVFGYFIYKLFLRLVGFHSLKGFSKRVK